MSQIGEAIAFAKIDSPIRKCPFEEVEAEEVDPEDEDLTNDDTVAVAAAQENNGGVLGENVIEGSPGKVKTWNALGGSPETYKAARVDTARTGVKVTVPGDTRQSPFTVAAHHLIPGNAALYDSDLFNSYMKKNGKMKLTDPPLTLTLAQHIGYNVNGSHNGVWLPGSYAIRTGTHPRKHTWSVLIEDSDHLDWCYDYMAAVSAKANGQFHDAHTDYSRNVKKCLEELTVRLRKHQQGCEDCQDKKDAVPPPYAIKQKLYRLSRFLRTKVTGRPAKWQDTWMTSDQVLSDIWGSASRKKAFIETHREAASNG